MAERNHKGPGRLELAMRAKCLFVPYLQLKGTHEAATADMPSHWHLESWNLLFTYVENTLLLPSDQHPSCLLDIWSAAHKKQLSVSWQPDRPWQPLRIASFDPRGAWIPLLDLIPPAGGVSGASASAPR